VLVGILFSVLFTPRYGLVNRVFQIVLHWGLEARWLSDPRLIMAAIVLTSLWLWVGFNMIYFLAALQTVDKTLQRAAAAIDGGQPLADLLARDPALDAPRGGLRRDHERDWLLPALRAAAHLVE